MRELGLALHHVRQLLALTGILLMRHWPQLLSLYLAGASGRMLFLWLALWLSKFNALLGTLMLPLAPLCVLLSLVVMFRVCASSLPAFSSRILERDLDLRWRENLKVGVQALIPFVAVYASQKFLSDDAQFFIHTSTADEFRNNELNANYARVNYASGWVLTMIIVLAMTARKWISVRQLAAKSLGWGVLGGYLETLWLVTLGTALTSQISKVQEWMTSRAVVVQLLDMSRSAREMPNSVYSWIKAGLVGLGELLTGCGNLIVLPVAWLAIGALIYGSKLSEEKWRTHEQMTEQIRRLPPSLLKVVVQFLEPVLTPIQSTLAAVRTIASVGLVSMVLYCVLLALTGKAVKALLAFLMRWVLGPRPAEWQDATLPYLLLAERGVFFMVTVVLVAAGVNFILARQTRGESEHVAPSVDTVDGGSFQATSGGF